jgi:hypothetical protein
MTQLPVTDRYWKRVESLALFVGKRIGGRRRVEIVNCHIMGVLVMGPKL